MEETKNKSIDRLLKDYRDGKASALEDLMLLTYKELYRISYGYLKDSMLAEDAVSETFISLINKIHTVKNDKNLSGYLRTVVINKSLDILRKRKNDFFPGDGYLSSIPDMSGQENVKYVLEMLDGDEREVLLLWNYDYTLAEISQKTNFTINQVRLLLQKAKANFIANYSKGTTD